MQGRRRVLSVAAVTSSVVVASVIGAAPSQAATSRAIESAHVSLTAVSGSVPVGAVITVIETCPRGADLDRRMTRQIGEVHDDHVAVRSREYWVGGVATRYVVTAPIMDAEDMTVAGGVAMCRMHVRSSTRTFSGRAATDVRIWGPAPSDVQLFNVTVMAVLDTAHPQSLVRTTIRGAGVGSSRGSLSNAVRAVQEGLDDQEGAGGVVATGSTTRAVPAGSFASMENRYRFQLQF